jgi:hypothetical protein
LRDLIVQESLLKTPKQAQQRSGYAADNEQSSDPIDGNGAEHPSAAANACVDVESDRKSEADDGNCNGKGDLLTIGRRC